MSLGTHVTLAVLAFCVIVGEPSHAGEHTPTHTVGLQNAEQTSQAVSPSLIVPFLVGLVVPCVLKLLLDYLAQFSEVRPVNTALLYAQIAVYIVAHYISLFIGVGTLLFAAVERPQNFADLACGAIGCLASMYSFDFTLTAASKFRKIWCCKQFVSLPPRTRRLLPNTLKKLIHIASGSDSCTELPFSQFLQLVVFSLQLADEQLLHNILDASCSGPTARRLAHLVKRLPSFRRALQTKNRFVFDAFALPAREATRPDSPNSVSFSERVDLATYFLKLQDKELLDTLFHPSIGSTSTCAAKLRQLYDRVVDPNNFSDVGRGYLLPDTLNKLIHVANRSDSCTELPFSQFLQLVEFSLQLADEQILHNILDASCSGPTARRLAHLVKRLPSFRRALQTKNRFVFDAFALPAREATRPDSPNSVSFSERVDLATYFLKLQDKELLDTLFHPSIGSTSTCAAKLRQLYDRVVDPNGFSDVGRGYLLPDTLNKLIHVANRSDSCTELPFSQFLQLVEFCLQLADEQILHNILDASCSGPTARRLAHLAKRLPSFRRALQTKNRFVFDAFALPAREATRPDSPNSVSFSERVDLATYFLKLQDTELLDTLFHPSIGSTSTCAAKLRQLYDRVVDPNNFSDKGRGYLPVALKDLLLSMSAENHSTTLAFAVQVELIMLYLKLVGKKLSDNQVCMELGCVEDQEREMRVCDGEEGPWIRYWVQRFDGTLKATGRFGPSPVDIMKLAEEPPRFLLPASLEQDIIRLVLLLYARIASAGSSDGDSSHMNVYHQIMQQEGEQVFAY